MSTDSRSDSLVNDCIERLQSRGFDRCQVRETSSQKHELQAEFNVPSMLRTVNNRTLQLSGIVDGKRASCSLNKVDSDSIDAAVAQLWDSALAAPADDANEISAAQKHQSFESSCLEPDLDKMCDRLDEFLDHTNSNFPSVTLGVAGISHAVATQHYANSNGVLFDSRDGCYSAQAMFTARDKKDVSSFSYSGVSTRALDRPVAECGSFDRLMANAVAQVCTQKVPQKFVGDLIITPDCLGSFIGFLLNNIGSGPMISGTSIYKGRLHEQVAADALTICSLPCDMPSGHFVTDDGYPSENGVVVENGKLQTYLLDLYASRKTGFERTQTGGCYEVAPGDVPFETMLGDVQQGVLISRFSGGRPSEKGDFSGVAKNSFYIEDGEVRQPISETMVSGNLAALLMDIDAVSIETVHFGSSHYPWVKVSNIGVS